MKCFYPRSPPWSRPLRSSQSTWEKPHREANTGPSTAQVSSSLPKPRAVSDTAGDTGSQLWSCPMSASTLQFTTRICVTVWSHRVLSCFVTRHQVTSAAKGTNSPLSEMTTAQSSCHRAVFLLPSIHGLEAEPCFSIPKGFRMLHWDTGCKGVGVWDHYWVALSMPHCQRSFGGLFGCPLGKRV